VHSVNTAFMSQTFGCLAVTLEMPFKDAANSPVPGSGWAPSRCAKLGAAMLDALLRMGPHLLTSRDDSFSDAAAAAAAAAAQATPEPPPRRAARL
jgi:hypothetical protein